MAIIETLVYLLDSLDPSSWVSARMPISLSHAPTTECNFSEWSIEKNNRSKLIEVVAYLYLRQEENAQRVINALEPRRRVSKGRVAQNVIRKLTAPNKEDLELLRVGSDAQKEAARKRIKTSIVHRDGLLFQHISCPIRRPCAGLTALGLSCGPGTHEATHCLAGNLARANVRLGCSARLRLVRWQGSALHPAPLKSPTKPRAWPG